MIFTLNKPEDEVLIILLDGEEIGQYCHDSDGWAGMEAAEDLVRTIAARLNIEVEVTYD